MFSSRIVLNALGVTNYGLYNVVGSIVVMINSAGIALQSVSYRYLAVELGKKNNQDVAKVFSFKCKYIYINGCVSAVYRWSKRCLLH